MLDVHQYMSLADEADRSARQASNRVERSAWLEIARGWRLLASDAAPATQTQPEQAAKQARQRPRRS
jgi:hypothetical protein